MQSKTHNLFKIMLAGDVSTGKTSFLTQLIYQYAERNPLPTQTLGFFTLRLTNPDSCLQIWDSPGDPRHHYQVMSFLTKFQAVLLFIDVTNSHTRDCVATMIEYLSYVEVRCYPSLQVHIIEAKHELTLKDPLKRKVTRQELQIMANQVGGGFFSYERDKPVEPILQEIILWSKKVVKQVQEKQTSDKMGENCDCSLY